MYFKIDKKEEFLVALWYFLRFKVVFASLKNGADQVDHCDFRSPNFQKARKLVEEIGPTNQVVFIKFSQKA